MTDANGYRYLGPELGSHYRQFVVTGRGVRAATLYYETLGDDARTPQEVADDFDVPLEAVLESIRYCQENAALLRQEYDEDTESIRARGYDKPPYVPAQDETKR
jgi:hypothetical protein